MTIMTGRKLDTLRAAAQREGQGPHSQEYIVGLKLQVYELQDKVEQLEQEAVDLKGKLLTVEMAK